MIAGADSPAGGELIRLLVHHPDVVVTAAYAPEHAGMPISTYHCGLAGDTDMCFADAMQASDGDVLFIADDSTLPFDPWAPGMEHLRIVDMSHTAGSVPDMVLGICELNRKPMVRGARMVHIPDPRAQLVSLALLPLAKSLLLSDGIKIEAQWPEGTNPAAWTADVDTAIRELQSSWQSTMALTEQASDSKTSNVTVTVPTKVALTQIQGLYADFYEDHNFVHLFPTAATTPHVLNTMKCLINLSDGADGASVRIHAMLDPMVKGGAGNAVHAMNLLFGLQETTGLQLKALTH